MYNRSELVALLTATTICILNYGTLAVSQEVDSKKVDVDILLENGKLYLGDGAVPEIGSVAISDGNIVAVGEFEVGQVKLRLDCSGLAISPGFIDLHNHSDRGVLNAKTRAVMNYLTQGCTTIVTGNCGSGPIEVGEYYSKLDEYGIGVNVAHLIPQGSLREEVIGDDQRPAKPVELAQMRDIVERGMHEGAWGMSTGLIYVPSSFADTDELVSLAKIVGGHNGIYASHIRGEGKGLLDSVGEALEIGRRAALPIHISHFKSSGKDSWGLVRTAIEIINDSRMKGQIVTADQYPYTASSTSLSATTVPAWARSGGRKRMLERLDSNSSNNDSDRIQAAIARKLELTDNGHRIQIARYRKRPDWAGARLDEIAIAEQISPLELVLKIERNGGASVVNHSINEDDVRFVMNQPWVATASDGSSRFLSDELPHPRSYGTFPRKIGFYAIREQTLAVEDAIRSSTGLPADILGLEDRGYLKKGFAADIAVWSEPELIDKATFTNPHSYSQGIVHVLVNGVPAIINSRPTGALAGKPLRHQSPRTLPESE